uniref:F-box domain-containing protein n=1 Tax=Caenorhabditis tropicalis TaxID=1561998 RepID=A0A1I7U5H6_9PELO
MQPLLIHSNMSLVPYTFPLLNLPIVTLRIVADYWDPFEIYNLSLISKRAKSLAVSLSPKAHQVSLEFHDCFCVQFSGLPGYGFIPSRGENGFELQEFRIGKLYSFSKSPAKEIQKAMRCLTELFKCRSIEFCLLDGSVSELIDWLRLFNEYHVKSGSYEFENEETVRIFFDIYRAPTDLMSFHFSGNATKGLVALPEQTTVDFIRSSVFYDISHLNWHFIKFFDSQNLGILCDKLTKHRIVGLFLESWMSGKCNRQAQTINFLMHEKIRLEEAIKGIPRIESRVVKRYEE